MKLKEMTMMAGSLNYNMGRFLSIYAKTYPASYKYVGDIELVQVWYDRLTNIYLLVQDDKPQGWFFVVPSNDNLELKGAFVAEPLRGNRYFEKFIWFLKKHVEHGSSILLGDVHSTTTKHIIANLARADRFVISWLNLKTHEKISLKDQPELGYSAIAPTMWRVLLENDGDFSTWPRYYLHEHMEIKQWYDFLLEPST